MYVKVKRLTQTGDIYTFSFECDSKRGVLKLDAGTKKLELIEPMDGRDGQQNYFRARAAILRELERGVIPTETSFASA